MYVTYTKSGLSMVLRPERRLQRVERVQAPTFIFSDPAFVDLVDRYGIQVVQLFTATPHRDDQIGLFEQSKMFAYSLTRHVQLVAQFAQSLTVFGMQQIQQLPPRRIRQVSEDPV